MAIIKCFEDIEVWQLEKVLENKTFKLCNIGSFVRDFDLKNKINSGTDLVIDNIVKGFEIGGRKKYLNFLSISK